MRLRGLLVVALLVAALLVLGSPVAKSQCQMTSKTQDIGPFIIKTTTVKVNATTTLTLVAYKNPTSPDYYEVYIYLNGIPYTNDIVGNPTGLYDINFAGEIVNSFCKGQSGQAELRPRTTPAATTDVSGAYAGLVAVADFNGDGIPDSAVITSSGFTVTLIGANGQPSSTHSYPVANIGASIVAADFNLDGHTDLAVLSDPESGGGSVIVYLGRGDGTFAAGTSFPAGAFPFYLATGDFNGDGKPDLAVSVFASQLNAPGTVDVLIGKGDGTFAAAVPYTVGLAPGTIVTADFTGDGILDIAVLDAESGITNKVWILPGKGDGTFLSPVSTATGTNAGYLQYADFDHDGNLDLLIADELSSTMVQMFGKGGGAFQAPQKYFSTAYGSSLGIVPVADGTTAIFAPDNANGLMDVYFASSTGVLVSPAVQTVGKSPAAVAEGDVNGDKLPDIALTDSESNNLYLEVSKGKGVFASPVAYALPATPGPLAMADLNNDGNADVIVATTSGLAVLLGSSSGSLSAVRSFGSGASFNSVTVADFNGDGKPDVASANGTAGAVSIFLGNGDGSFQSPRQISFASGLMPIGTASADVNRDGKADLIVALSPSDSSQSGVLAVLLGNGDGTFQNPTYIQLPGPLLQQGVGGATVAALAVGDLNGDSKPDIVTVLSTGPNQVAVLLGNGNGTFGGPILTTTNTYPPQMAIADLNGDGKPDLILGDCCGLSEASFLAGNGDGAFQAELQFPSGPNPVGIAVADFDGDGTLDLAILGQIQEPNQGTLAIMYGAFASSGSVTPTATATVASAANPNGAAIAPGSLASAFGADLATSVASSTSSVSITDSAGHTALATLIYVSPAQINFYVPLGIANGSANITITSGDGTLSAASVQIAPVAPGLFELNGAGLAAAYVIVYSGGTQTVENVYSVNSSGAVVANPISLGAGTDQAYLFLFGTGIQDAGTAGVTVTVGGVPGMVKYAGMQGAYSGEDQINVLLPSSLAGEGSVTVQLTANGIAANPVNVTIQ
jgi:uncharacterized protein (TIGR03437 family)